MLGQSVWKKFWSKRYIWLTIAAVTSQMFLVANALSWTSSAIPKMPKLPEEAVGTLGDLFLYGTILGSLICLPTLIYLPRKTSLILNEVILLVAWGLLFFKTNLPLLYIGRFLAGISTSSIALNVPVYEAEVFHPVDRQISGGIMCLYTAAGLWAEYSVAPFLSYEQVVMINLIPIILFLISFPCYGVETPFHLVKCNKMAEAEAVINKFWSKDSIKEDIDKELENIKVTIREEKELGISGAFRSIFTDKANFKACFLALMLISLYSAAGLIQIAMYMQLILIKAQVKEISSAFSSAVIGTVKLGGAILAIPVINLIGVKRTLMLTLTGNAFSLVLLGGYFYAKEVGSNVDLVYWLPLTSLALFFMFSLMGSSMLPYVMRGEILPRHLRGPGGATTDVISGVFAVAANYLYIAFSEGQIYWAFWCFSLVMIVFIIFIRFFVPETKDKTLHEIQQELGV